MAITTSMNASVPSPQVSASATAGRPAEASVSKGSRNSPAVSEAQSESAKGQDKIELSTEALRLAQTRRSDEQKKNEQLDTIRKLKQDVETETKKDEPERDKPEVDEVGEDSWQQQRHAKLDRLETMVRQGLYKVDPFMLDVLAIRMVRMIG